MNKKAIVGIIIAIIIVIALVAIYFFTNKVEKPEDVINTYFSKISDKKYEEAFDMISQSSKDKVAKETFIEKNNAIYDGIDMTNLTTEIKSVENDSEGKNVLYHQKMNTSAGEVEFDNSVVLVKEDNEYKLNWSNSIIYPDLVGDNDKIRVKTLEAERGNIYDRNNTLLAGKGNISSIGLVPGKMSANRDEDIEKLARI